MEKVAFWNGFVKAAGSEDWIPAVDTGVVGDDPQAQLIRDEPKQEKKAEFGTHAAELAGLATLAVPSFQKLRGKKMDDSTSHKYDLAGLGILAAPSVAALGKKALGK